MPIMIQDFASGSYLSTDGGWTSQPSKAQRFDQLLRAWEAIDEYKLSGVRVVIGPQSIYEGKHLA
jgi:hypothetical protein